MTILAVQNINCKVFNFESKNVTSATYWHERWELYKHSYALAVWARTFKIQLIEFYNEPDFDLGVCLDSEQFLDNYLIRSLSIQNAYNDFNRNEATQVNVKVLASAFATKLYGGDPNKNLGQICVKNIKRMFGNTQSLNWSNMHMYSYHVYDKSGSDLSEEVKFVQNSIKKDLNYQLPMVVSEYSAHSTVQWSFLNSTADDAPEASRLASQIMGLALANVTAHFAFRFSVLPSSATSASNVALNGLHWGETSAEPFYLTDTTLSAEAMRLLTLMKGSKIFSITFNDTTKGRSFLASKKDDEPYVYFYAVNDHRESTTVNIDLTRWGLNSNTKLLVEIVNKDYWGEVSNIIVKPSSNIFSFMLDSFTTMRLTMPIGLQVTNTFNSTMSCTLFAGTRSNQVACLNQSNLIGTSNTFRHEETSVMLIKFETSGSFVKNSKYILSLNVEEIVGSASVTAMVLGLKAHSGCFDEEITSWKTLSDSSYGRNILNTLNSGTIIDEASKNFINWSNPTIAIVGHVSAKKGKLNEIRMIDATEYVNNNLKRGEKFLTFVIYRPFRHTGFKSGNALISADDLSKGSIIKVSGTKSPKQPKLIQLSHY